MSYSVVIRRYMVEKFNRNIYLNRSTLGHSLGATILRPPNHTQHSDQGHMAMGFLADQQMEHNGSDLAMG